MSNFTDEQPRVATEKDCTLPWHGVKGAALFRCHLCGHKFQPGDTWRWVYSHHGLNPTVCEACDGPDVLDRWERHQKDLEKEMRRFWWALEPEEVVRRWPR